MYLNTEIKLYYFLVEINKNSLWHLAFTCCMLVTSIYKFLGW